MENKLYLIHEEDYVKHIDEAMVLYTMLKDTTGRISELPSGCVDKELTGYAERADRLAEKIYRTWGKETPDRQEPASGICRAADGEKRSVCRT